MGGDDGEPVSSLGGSWAEAAASSGSHRDQPVSACRRCALADDYGVRAIQALLLCINNILALCTASDSEGLHRQSCLEESHDYQNKSKPKRQCALPEVLNASH